MPHLQLPEPWLERPVRVLLIGAGGTGSQLFGVLLALDHTPRALSHPGGLHLTVYDPDRVTAANLGRQAFWPADVGQNKAVTLVQRANLALGLDWVAAPRTFRGPARRAFPVRPARDRREPRQSPDRDRAADAGAGPRTPRPGVVCQATA